VGYKVARGKGRKRPCRRELDAANLPMPGDSKKMTLSGKREKKPRRAKEGFHDLKALLRSKD